ncbi:MAG: hypothetical protein M3O46_13260 [Myxococcota bacterium]|nr:hypothetical protein [Myxococcota bacterium]
MTVPVVVIGGASGFVGRELGAALAERFRVIGISRGAPRPGGAFSEWRSADLLNLGEAEEALRGARYAVYLVHSMMPSARLTQASFADLDLLSADNFARAAASAGVEQIIYLGGLVPESARLSPHLESRREVEGTLARHGVPVTTLRAGLVIGGGGSSFEMLVKLVRRLPAMICPRWTQNRMQPIAIDDVVKLLAFVVGRHDCFGQVFDVGAPELLTYRELMVMCAELLGVHRTMIPVRLFTPSLSRLWVSLVTGAPAALVGPLVESLRHEMIARDHRLADMAGITLEPVRDALSRALMRPQQKREEKAETPTPSVVRSVQRILLPQERDAAWAAGEYARWLPRVLRGLVHVDVDPKGNIRFFLLFLRLPLLVLRYAADRSTPERQLFFVDGGLLSRPNTRGRFELRQVLDRRTMLVAVHDYSTRLPWLVYVATQARFHAWVMAAFRRHLAAIARIEIDPAGSAAKRT